MTENKRIAFGDNVRVRSTRVTDDAGVAGLFGQVYGETTPSVTNVDVIGVVKQDFAFNVFFKDRGEAFWFAPELIEFVDHGAGTEIRLDGVPMKWVRTEAGEWEESVIETARPEKSEGGAT